jgi:hypothetical protein
MILSNFFPGDLVIIVISVLEALKDVIQMHRPHRYESYIHGTNYVTVMYRVLAHQFSWSSSLIQYSIAIYFFSNETSSFFDAVQKAV